MRACRVALGARCGQREAIARATEDPAGFWAEHARQLYWEREPRIALRRGDTADEWFPDGTTNLCVNAVDVHLDTLGDSTALTWDSPVAGEVRHLTYNELHKLVSNTAAMLLKKGVRPGDRVMIYMSMTLEAQAAMLACARVGAVHVVCFGGFASTELAKRIVDCKPCLIIASSCGIPAMGKVIDYKRMLDQALQISGLSDSIPRVIVRRKELMCDLSSRVGEEDFFDLLGRSPEVADPVFLPSGAPSYIIFTSGTTGKPKGVVRDIGGYATALKWSMKAIFDLNPRDVMFTASDIGWVVGHSYILYAPLLQGCQSVVYEGKPVGTPDAGAYWRIIENHKANAMFASPTGLRAVKREDPAGALKQGYDTTSLRHIFLAGERTDTDTLEWAECLTGVPVYDHWWQTESGWPISAPCVGLNPSTPESKGAGLPVPGWQVAVQASEGDEAGPHTLSQGELEDATEMGSIVVKRPLPPGMLSHLWETPEEVFAEKYLTADRSAYVSGDAGYIGREGHVNIMARTDDIMNVSAIRVSTGSIEEAMSHHPSVAEGVVVGQRDSFKGEAPVAFYTLKAGVEEGSDVLAELNKLITTHVGGFARLKAAVHVHRLPKTRSGKTLRVTLRRMVNKDEYTVPVAIEDDTVLDEVLSQIASAFRRGDL